ncbi:MAG: MotA/TolQ/ExbB proton channel family protein [Campylobacterota bacterium]|nr:MotA/TolQ/ExbB proton channel family protein [Campylobacterota bacterium]
MNIQIYIDQGGIIVTVLIAMFGLGFTLILWKLFVILYVRVRREKIYAQYKNNISKDSDIHTLELMVSEIMGSLESGLNTIKTIATISPLLGLLGTVIGIYTAFVGISQDGLGDPSSFADGISMAMITTIAGLIVSIPHYIGYNYLIAMMNKLELLYLQELYSYTKSKDA